MQMFNYILKYIQGLLTACVSLAHVQNTDLYIPLTLVAHSLSRRTYTLGNYESDGLTTL